MKRIQDIFSYVPENTLSLENIEQAFNDVVNYSGTSSLEFVFERKAQRQDMQGAINELIGENKEVALVKVDGEEVAVIGFVDK